MSLYIKDITIREIKKEVRVHSAIALMLWARLWYLCRSLDNKNRGIIDISWQELQRFFFITEKCLYKWLAEGKNNGAFRNYKRKGDRLRIILGSKKAIVKRLRIYDWGITSYIETGLLASPRKTKKEIVRITALTLQKRAEIAETRKQKERGINLKNRVKTKDLIVLYGAIQSETSMISRKGKKYGKLGKFLKTQETETRGGTQKGIGEHLNVTERTVNNYIRNEAICQTVKEISKKEAESRTFEKSEGEQIRPYFKHLGKYYEFSTNLYDYEYKLIRELYQKYKFYLSMKNRDSGYSTYRRSISKNYTSVSFRDFKNLLFLRYEGDLKGMIEDCIHRQEEK